MKAIWKEIPKDPKKGRWVGMYVTLNPKGEIVLSRRTWEKSGCALAYQIFFDQANQRIGLKPSTPNSRGAYLAGPRGRHGGRRILAFPVMAECGIILKHTVQFPEVEIDIDGLLILDLRTAAINKSSLTWHKRKETAAKRLGESAE